MKLGQDILYLSDADVRAADLGLAEVEAAVEAVLAFAEPVVDLETVLHAVAVAVGAPGPRGDREQNTYR